MSDNKLQKVIDRKQAASELALRVLTAEETRDVAGAQFVKVGPIQPVPPCPSGPMC